MAGRKKAKRKSTKGKWHSNYNKSERGRARRQRWREAHRDEILAYNRAYHRKRQRTKYEERIDALAASMTKDQSEITRRRIDLEVDRLAIKLKLIDLEEKYDQKAS